MRVLSLTDLLEGPSGTVQTLAPMVGLVQCAVYDLGLRAFAHSLVDKLSGHDFDGEIQKIFEFVRDKIRYAKDPVSVELVQTPRLSLDLGFGDCDDKCVLLNSLLAALGHAVLFNVVSYDGVSFGHVFCSAWSRSRGDWISLDATNEKAVVGWRTEQIEIEWLVKIF